MSQTTYADIKAYSQDFMQIVQNNPELPFSQLEMPLVVFVDKLQLMALLAIAPKLAILPGVENGKLTFSILGVTEKNEVLPEHINGSLDGEETWPEEDLIIYNQIKDDPESPTNVYNQFLQ